MDSGSGSRQVGRHLLGPHVVGRRVVVRRLVRGETGPSGGPAMTDVLGTCTAWGDGRCVVAPESGEPVEIALADIVSGKPVPPRPSVRHRVSAADAEAHVAALWPHLETEPLGAWTLRSDPAPVGRLRRRANSCLAMGDPGLAFGEAERRIRRFYADRDRPVLAQVELGSEVEDAFRAAGWEPLGSGDAHFLIASLARALRSCNAVFGSPSAGSNAHFATRTPRYSRSGPGQVAVEILEGEAAVARGAATYERDWLGLHGLEVEPGHRRRGLGTAALAALLEWGAEQGATTAWLHVETDNAPAEALYGRLGFDRHHTGRFLRPADG
jgi:GNAT superfamily N-acetyltransferase